MRAWVAALRLVGLGWYIVACIGIGLVAGLKLDELLHTPPWFMLLGLLVGIGAAFVGVYRLIQSVFAEEDK